MEERTEQRCDEREEGAPRRPIEESERVNPNQNEIVKPNESELKLGATEQS
ncbi:hypothetical protein SESBI_33254 [Sesbania bispinosa]|nr:hypothetical protein SESBI_33254 [Sesbania bispinosa]